MPDLEDKELLKNMYIDLKALFDNLKNIASF